MGDGQGAGTTVHRAALSARIKLKNVNDREWKITEQGSGQRHCDWKYVRAWDKWERGRQVAGGWHKGKPCPVLVLVVVVLVVLVVVVVVALTIDKWVEIMHNINLATSNLSASWNWTGLEVCFEGCQMQFEYCGQQMEQQQQLEPKLHQKLELWFCTWAAALCCVRLF